MTDERPRFSQPHSHMLMQAAMIATTRRPRPLPIHRRLRRQDRGSYPDPAFRLGAQFEHLPGQIHFHMLFLDGVYTFDRAQPTFHRAPRPTPTELAKLLHTVSIRVARLLERQALIVRDAESDYLDTSSSAKHSIN